MNALSIKNLSKVYSSGVIAYENISLDLNDGMFGLLGPNGAGKSSFMKTIAGLLKPDQGQILFNGQDVIKHPENIKKQLGFLPQDFGVYPKVSAYELLTHIAILKGLIHAGTRKEQVLALLDKTNLYAERNKEVHTFSGGMRQRFGVAQALLGDPKILIVDEPAAGLDPEERHRLNNLLSEIGENKVVILATHLVEDIKDLCTTMAVLFKGRIIAQGNPADFIRILQGKIWQLTINKQDLPYYQEHYKILSARLAGGKLSLHIYATTNPGNGFHQIEPSLEDVYFNLSLS